MSATSAGFVARSTKPPADTSRIAFVRRNFILKLYLLAEAGGDAEAQKAD
jgi:hypothetical protein